MHPRVSSGVWRLPHFRPEHSQETQGVNLMDGDWLPGQFCYRSPKQWSPSRMEGADDTLTSGSLWAGKNQPALLSGCSRES